MSRTAGQTIGHFQVERLLSRGGMGEAYLARDLRTGAAVLLKLPVPELLSNVAAQARFDREGQALRQLDHPGVQRWVESGHDGPRPYLALAYVDGESLRDRLRRQRRLSLPEALRLAEQLAGALGYCHAHGVVHRDLKPENVIITPDGRPVLIDFGSVLLEGARRLTYAGLTGELGTPEYMAPEQVQGQRGDARTDVYALGTLIYELLTGAPPFAARPDDGAVQVMRRHLEEAPAAPDVPGLDGAVAGVLAKALRRDPDARFATAEAFARALTDPAGAVATGEVAPGWPAEPGSGAGLGPAAPVAHPVAPDWLRYVLAATVMLLVLAMVGILAVALRDGGVG